MHLGQASKVVQDAVIESVHKDVEALINAYMGSGMAAMFRGQALEKLHNPEGRALVLRVVTNALAAEEKARSAEEASSPNKPPAA